jgi:hypothetical protein
VGQEGLANPCLAMRLKTLTLGRALPLQRGVELSSILLLEDKLSGPDPKFPANELLSVFICNRPFQQVQIISLAWKAVPVRGGSTSIGLSGEL